MVQTLCRMYPTNAEAEAAFAELGRYTDYEDKFLFSATDPATGSALTRDAVEKAMMGAFIPRAEAQVYAARVAAGHSLVAVHAPFGTALTATTILDRHGPIDSGIPAPAYEPYQYDPRTPFSSVLWLPTLSKTRLPFQKVTGLPTLTEGPALMTRLLGPLLTGTKVFTTFMPMLTRDRTPFSNLLNLPTLTEKKFFVRP
ncbi:hypothetical protein [Prosthecomicrobium sp. N25]|uniref:hypothetical protein n=1 Tax=Prosthecomicrobium sp. N25 TaxID=3129254 RepID=UPI003076A1E8